MKKHISFALIFVYLIVLLLTSCSTETSDIDTTVIERKETVTVAMNLESEPTTGFDPAYGWGAGEHTHEPLIQSTLTVTTLDLNIGNDLATSYSVSDDGMIWTVNIRDDVYFTDGVKLTAHDVAFTYNLVKEKSTVNDFTMLSNAVATDDLTIEFHMTRPYSIWPYTMAIVGIVPQHAYDENYAENPIGSGRYILKEWQKNQQIILEANPNYYGDEVKMKHVNIVFLSEDTAFAAAKAGQVDLTYTSATYSDEQISGFQLLSYETVDNRGFNLPTSNNQVTSDIAIRQAINIGIDREEMIEQVLNGYGSAAFSVCDKMPWYNPDVKVEYDQAQAITILEEAGWILGDDNIRQKDGVKATLTLMYPSGDSVREALTYATANQLSELGIECAVKSVSWDTAYDDALTDPLCWGWGSHSPMELYNIYHTQPDTNSAQFSPYSSEIVDNYMDLALESNSLEESYELWQKAQFDGENGILVDTPWVWLVNIDHLYFADETLNVAAQKIHPHGHGWSVVNNVDQWTWNN